MSGAAKTVYVGGQNAVDASGAVVGKGDLKAQTEQVFKNLKTALEAGGAKLHNVVKWNIYIVEGQPLEQGFEVFQRVWGKRQNPPVITTVFVSNISKSRLFSGNRRGSSCSVTTAVSVSIIQFIGDRGVRNIEEKFVESYQQFGFGLYLVELKLHNTPICICCFIKTDT